jgi:hypothetical protein
MTDWNLKRLLTLFADAKPHSFFETCILGSIMLKTSQRKLESLFKRRLLANGLVRRMHQSWDPRLDFYELTKKGDDCFRDIQIAHLKREKKTKDSEEAMRHYKYFNREVGGQFGVEGMSKEISEKTAGLREKYPHLYAR